MDAVDKDTGIDHITVHVVAVLLVGGHYFGIVAQQLAVDKGIVAEILPEIPCHLRHHDDRQHQHAQHAQRDHSHAHICAPAGMIRLFAAAAATGLSGRLPAAMRRFLSLRRGRRGSGRPGFRFFHGRRFQRLFPGEIVVIDKGIPRGGNGGFAVLPGIQHAAVVCLTQPRRGGKFAMPVRNQSLRTLHARPGTCQTWTARIIEP